MLPIAPLMIEHRLIERMIRLMGREIARIRDNIAVGQEFAFVDAKLIDTAVDFMKTYADQVHHGKEEDHPVYGAPGKTAVPGTPPDDAGIAGRP